MTRSIGHSWKLRSYAPNGALTTGMTQMMAASRKERNVCPLPTASSWANVAVASMPGRRRGHQWGKLSTSGASWRSTAFAEKQILARHASRVAGTELLQPVCELAGLLLSKSTASTRRSAVLAEGTLYQRATGRRSGSPHEDGRIRTDHSKGRASLRTSDGVRSVAAASPLDSDLCRERRRRRLTKGCPSFELTLTRVW